MFFLITGASGMGKSTVRKLIEPEFAGVLEVAELGMLGSTPKWKIEWRHRFTFIHHHVAFADWMRHHVVDHRHRPEVIMGNAWPQMRWDRWVGIGSNRPPWSSHVIETSQLGPTEVAQLVAEWLRQYLRPAQPPSPEFGSG